MIDMNEGRGTFARRTGHSLELGKVVVYRLISSDHSRFEILACRDGIRIEGIFPWVGPDGVQVLQAYLTRAVKHHQHLAMYPVGAQQDVLDEQGLIAEENVDALAYHNLEPIKGKVS